MDTRRQRIYDAQRTGLKNRIRDEWHVLEERANALLDDWDHESARQGLAAGQAGYWAKAEVWIRGRIDDPESRPGETAG